MGKMVVFPFVSPFQFLVQTRTVSDPRGAQVHEYVWEVEAGGPLKGQLHLLMRDLHGVLDEGGDAL